MSTLSVPLFNGRVTVIGDVMLDRYWSGPSKRISPEAPVPVVKIDKREDRAGGAANVAINIAALGAPCSLVGIIGNDEAGEQLNALVTSKHIDTDFIKVENLPTITKLRVLSRNQQLLRLDFEEGYSDVDHGLIMQTLRKALRNSKVLICSDYGKGALACVPLMIKAARDLKIPVLIDPKGTDFNRYRGATLLTPNMAEFQAVAGIVKDEEDLVKKALKMIADFDLSALLVTRSEDGMSLIRPGLPPVHLPTHAREVYDVTGAGDTVIATLAAGLAAGLDLISACEISNRAAGIVVGKLGTSTASPQELKQEIEGTHRVGGVINEDDLLTVVNTLKSQQKRIVMTNGCFDIIHKGHVDYLKRARALGDVLIVAVNSDESVQKLKGPTRPIVTLNDRMEVLEALGCVDFVVPFSEETPQRLIAKILPDILVKGGDYTVEQIAGHKEVLANGGKVIILPFVAGKSTTNIVKKIKESN